MRKILVTGGAGFIGSALVDALSKDKDNEVIVVDDFSTGNRENLWFVKHRDNVRVIEDDVNDCEFFDNVKCYKFDYVFHLAACVGVQRTLANPMDVLDDINGISNIMALCYHLGVKRVFYSSSSEVYGEPVEIPQHEDSTPLNTKLPYAQVKAIGESYLKAYHKEHGLNYTIFRYFNTYGPNQSNNFVIPKFIDLAIEGNNLQVYGDGSQSRTYCYIDDNIATQLDCLYKEVCVNEVVNIGSEIDYSALDLAQMVIRIVSDCKSEIDCIAPLEEGDMKRRQPDNSKMMSIIQRELVDVRDGIRKVVEYKLEKAEKLPKD